ncbi:hypothetical protein OSTOST_15941, partial [Ostertagia ostertagi]
LAKVSCVNSFSLTNNYSTTIGISLCIRLSVIDHSCKPNMRYAYRGSTAVMVPTDLSRMPLSLKEARHSYINDLLPRKMRRDILKRDYNFYCECEGCLDEERNERMEGWHCEECEDGWLRPREDATCSRTEHMLKYGKDLLSLQEQYQDKDDLALCHLKYGLAQAYKLAGDQESCNNGWLTGCEREYLVSMSVDFGWRRFNFFDKNTVQDPENPSERFFGLKDVCVDCWCSSTNGEAAYLGEQRGGVFRLGRGLDENYWKAYQTSLTALHVADDFIFSIGEDEEGTNSMLKIWKGDTFEKGIPVLCR